MTMQALALFGITAVVGLIFNALLVRFSNRLPFLKTPAHDRWHTGRIPDSGGIAIFGALAVAYFLEFQGRYVPVALGALALWTLGTIDDQIHLTPKIKIGAQAIIVTAVVGSGISVNVTSYNFVNAALSWLWLMGITNAFNLIDNMDGLAAGVVIIIAAFRSGLLYINGFTNESLLFAVIAASFSGFLVFNLKPAKIFMGDGGSMLAGFILAALTIHSPILHAHSSIASFFYPVLTFAYPIFDTTLVTTLRKIAGRKISVGGRDHSSHRLASLGMQDSAVVLTLWLFTAVGSAAAFLLYRLPVSTGIAILLLLLFASLFGLFLATLPAYPMFSSRAAGRLRALRRWVPSLRAGVTLLLDSTVAALAVITAFLIRFDLTIPASQYSNVLLSIPVIMASHALGGILFHTYDWSWEFFGVSEILPLAGAACVSTLAGVGFYFSVGDVSGGVVLLYAALSFGLTVMMRSSLRFFRQTLQQPASGECRRVAIFRADLEGEALARFLLGSATLALRPVVFLDDRPLREGVRVCGLPVRNIDSNLRILQREWKLDAVLLPPQTGEHDTRQALGGRFREIGLQMCTLDLNLRLWATHDGGAALGEDAELQSPDSAEQKQINQCATDRKW
jgi:UDP-GlcNAc:undecaprenyl-phosphate GlcNAc-1-phosphate transferase